MRITGAPASGRGSHDAEIEVHCIRLLVAEDDPQLRRLVCDRLRREGFDVLEVCDGAELLERIRTQVLQRPRDARPVDLVISDVHMPGRTGLEVLAAVRREAGQVPFILMTAFGDRVIHRQARRLGACAVFEKPFELDRLCSVVMDLVAA
jgi:two-component system response regulator (stage 0 sporulation protein F)